MSSEKDTYYASPNCTWKELGGNVIILQTQVNPPRTHELNSTGSFIWNKLQTRISFSSLLKEVLDEFDTDESRAREDLLEILKSLEDKNLLCQNN